MPEEVRARVKATLLGMGTRPATDHAAAAESAPEPKKPLRDVPQDGVAQPQRKPQTEGERRPKGEEEQREGERASVLERAGSMVSNNTWKRRHTVRFRGPRWATVLKNHRTELEQAFRQDLVEATGLEARRFESLSFVFSNVLIVTFVVTPEDDQERTDKLHSVLREHRFPRTVALYNQ
ncbi:putative mitotubule-associated protein Gb4 [Trypanosoma conorhini]|uniref:Putative mitotubule-associated protein Gb4 n=1 Tax=Trypanosoma conorhini TaxID=83891 RepID=A0A3R7LGI4_9TRYP|nr:putative mitotubule-associated protein Gb4 [Trypanosoma conorhini]RNF13933.1 putative mitotubule-associated protein Gb4 [Trypanosoma conorhini]